MIIFLACLGGGIFLILLSAHLTNPFNRLTVIRLPYRIRQLEPASVEDHTDRLRVHSAWPWRVLAVVQCGLYILHTRYGGSRKAPSATVQSIIKDIHKRRFRPDRLLLISGDHFNGLFVRNLGVFYYPTLDPRIVSDPDDWHDRQITYAQSLAYGLAVFAKRPVPTTTIVESGPYGATPVNFYAYPSDTVYGLLYALAALHGIEPATASDYTKARQTLETTALARQLSTTYHATLAELYRHYRKTVFDPDTGLIRTSIHVSGAKDITRRTSAFYDNVIFWKTTELAMGLGIIERDAAFLRKLKRTILKTFWLPEAGYFLEDLSDEGIAQAYYSSDWLIVLVTGFLDIRKPAERPYYEACMEHVRSQGIDQPLPLRYHADRRAHRQFFAVRLAVASYGGDAIWSFWGMEYIKCLLLLYSETGDTAYLHQADAHIAAYESAIKRVHGFPEVLDMRGNLLQTPLYRSIRQTGWVIGFEQVLAMRAALKA